MAEEGIEALHVGDLVVVVIDLPDADTHQLVKDLLTDFTRGTDYKGWVVEIGL